MFKTPEERHEYVIKKGKEKGFDYEVDNVLKAYDALQGMKGSEGTQEYKETEFNYKNLLSTLFGKIMKKEADEFFLK